MLRSRWFLTGAFVAVAAAALIAPAGAASVPLTTSSDEARAAYLEGRDLQEQLRNREAAGAFKRAVELDKNFAMAHFGRAATAQSTAEFWAALDRAVELAEGASEGERLRILLFNAGVRNDIAKRNEYAKALVAAHPDDERALNQVAGVYFGDQDWPEAIDYYNRAIEVDADYPAPYNNLGYAYRFTGAYDDAEKAFKKYIKLIPDEPNPYDSYAELLMKTGRYEESIKHYKEALEKEPSFAPSHVGIGYNQMLMGNQEAARSEFRKFYDVAKNDAERRQALLWSAASYLHAGEADPALEVIERRGRLALEAGDVANYAQDLVLRGDVLMRAGDGAGALDAYDRAVGALERADVPQSAKEAGRRAHLLDAGRCFIELGKVDEARRLSDAYAAAAKASQVPAELQAAHELAGRLALHEGRFAAAAAAFAQANQRDPEILYLAAGAHEKAGDAEKAAALYEQVADFNELNFNLAFVKSQAQERLAEHSAAN